MAIAQDNSEDAGKSTKASVNYRSAEGEHRCHTCSYSYGPKSDRHCVKVKGQIKPDDVCDLWKAKQ